MKKIILIFILVIIVIYISIPDYNDSLKLNTVYSKELILQEKTPTPSDLAVDDSVLIEVAKNILTDVLDEDIEFDEYKIVTELSNSSSLSQDIIVEFFKDSSSDYIIFFDLGTGELTGLSNFITFPLQMGAPLLSHEELRSLAYEYLERLPINSISNYSLVEENYNSFYYAEFENIFINKSISILINSENGDLSSFVLLNNIH